MLKLYTYARHDTIDAVMQWKILPQKSKNKLQQLLINRGVKTAKDKKHFFNPKISDFEDDLEIPGIAKAKKRIEQAIKNQELIIVYGDYDVDGICGAAVLYLGLVQVGAKVLPYIPHREKEGYGLSEIGLKFAKDQEARLVITVDCGIVNFKEAQMAKKLGLDLIITDHHQPEGNNRPEALVVIHSTKICGTAVAWCLIRQLVKERSEELLDLVAVATISDMMPMLGVNRALVKAGLQQLHQTKRIGLLALFNEAGIKKGEIGSFEIGHIIAPRLNAMGRLEHAIDSLRLLCTKDPQKAQRLANLLRETNSRRQQMTLEAIAEAQLKITKEVKSVYVLSSADWSPGIIGLVAGRICEITKRPTIAISLGETHSKGSARSVNGLNIIEVIRQCTDMLVAVGGHPGAAGFTIPTSRVEEFQKKIEELISVDDLHPGDQILDVELEVKATDLKLELATSLAEFEPFGINNPEPILATFNMKLTDLRPVGNGKHLKGKVNGVDFIAFGMGQLKDILRDGSFVDVAYNLEIDQFNGFEKLQLKVKDLHP